MGEEELIQTEPWEQLDTMPFVDGARRLRGYSASEDAWYEVVEFEETEETAFGHSSPESIPTEKRLPYVPGDVVWE